MLNNALTGAAPASIGDYDIVDELGRGGMGVIYQARQRSTGRVVALKVIQSGELATAEERERFHAEIKAARTLDHPHIVSVDDVGEHAGRLYYTMKLYPGVLADELDRFRDPAPAAALVATMARAVHHGHVRGVLHRDLKPANILLDEHGQPHVSDFGTAKCRGQPRLTATGVVVGTPMYMAPEQAAGGDQDVTTAADVYSLGIILYELLTGTPPFDGSDDESVLRALRDKDWIPASPRAHVMTVPLDLETICLKCLEKEAKVRYRSAEELADDLDQFLKGEPIAARPASPGERLWRFTRRHWLVVGAGMGTTLLLGVVAAAAIAVARTQEVDLRREALEVNRYNASAQADSVLLYMRDLIDPLKENFTDQELIGLLPRTDPHAPCPAHGDGPLQPQPGDVVFADLARRANDAYLLRHPSSAPARRRGTYDSVTLFDRCGKVIAFTSESGDRSKLRQYYDWRAYHQCAREIGEKGRRKDCVSRAFRAEYDGHYKFPIAIPIYDRDRWVGVVMAAISPQSAWDRTPLPGRHDREHVEILVAPRDRERNSLEMANHDVIVRHDPDSARVDEQDFEIDSPELRKLGTDHAPLVDNDLRDPLPGFEGRWLAGLASVGDTGFVVIIATRYDAAIAPNARLSLRLVWLVSAVILAWSIVFGAAMSGYARWRLRAPLSTNVPKATRVTRHTA